MRTAKWSLFGNPVPILTVWQAGCSSAAPPVPASELADPGVLVLPAYDASAGDVAPARMLLHNLPPHSDLTRWLHFSDRSRIRIWRAGMPEPAVPDSDDLLLADDAAADVECLFAANGSWPIGTSVTVDCTVRNAAGQVVAHNRVRLIGQVIAAIGDSMIYGFRRRRDGTWETPKWYPPWLNYPSRESWNSYPGTYSDIAYQGSRGYLQRSLTPSVPWAGHDPNGHGPPHAGYGGAKTTDLLQTLNDNSRAYPRSALRADPSHTAIVYFMGLNDVIAGRKADTIYAYWKQAVDTMLHHRAGRGRTLVIGVTLPRMRSDYSGYSRERQQQLIALNARLRNHTVSAPHARYVVADAEYVPHDGNDDGLHFLSTGYQRIEQIIRRALLDGLEAGS